MTTFDSSVAFVVRLVAVAAAGWLLWTAGYAGRWVKSVDGRQRATHAACEAAGLALGRYYAEQGHYPPSLASLVPRYLAVVPRDGWAQPLIYGHWRTSAGGEDSYLLASGGANERLDSPARELFAIPADEPQRVGAAVLAISNSTLQRLRDRRPWYDRLDDDIVYGGMSYLLDQPPVDDALIPPSVGRHIAANVGAALVVLAAAVTLHFRFRRRQEIAP
jgi:hypothetical protein